jgi:hypothetical protein
VLLTHYYPGNQIRKNELGRACGTIGDGFWREGLTERDNLGDLGVDDDNIKMDLQEVE